MEGLYAVGHHFGPSYDGPSGGYHFERGLVLDNKLVTGADIKQRGLANITDYWEALPGHALAWNGEVWIYAPVKLPAPVKAAAETPAPTVSVSKKRRKKRDR